MATGLATIRKKVTWVTLGPEPHLATCQRCGGHAPKPDLPAEFDVVIAHLDAAVVAHQYCKEPA